MVNKHHKKTYSKGRIKKTHLSMCIIHVHKPGDQDKTCLEPSFAGEFHYSSAFLFPWK